MKSESKKSQLFEHIKDEYKVSEDTLLGVLVSISGDPDSSVSSVTEEFRGEISKEAVKKIFDNYEALYSEAFPEDFCREDSPEEVLLNRYSNPVAKLLRLPIDPGSLLLFLGKKNALEAFEDTIRYGYPRKARSPSSYSVGEKYLYSPLPLDELSRFFKSAGKNGVLPEIRDYAEDMRKSEGSPELGKIIRYFEKAPKNDVNTPLGDLLRTLNDEWRYL